MSDNAKPYTESEVTAIRDAWSENVYTDLPSETVPREMMRKAEARWLATLDARDKAHERTMRVARDLTTRAREVLPDDTEGPIPRRIATVVEQRDQARADLAKVVGALDALATKTWGNRREPHPDDSPEWRDALTTLRDLVNHGDRGGSMTSEVLRPEEESGGA